MESQLVEKPQDERLILSKIDLFILPQLICLYLFCFLDRSNIGNAKVAGMDKDLGMQPSDFNWAISIFFAGYVIWEIPSNFLLKNWRASRLIPLITIIWASVTISISMVKNGKQLMAGRFFLGLAEAGLFPGILYYLTLWYTRTELAFRYAIFYSSSTLAGSLGGLLAAAVVFEMDGFLGLKGWQWIYITEGIGTMLVGIFCFFALPDNPERAWFLTLEQRITAKERVRAYNGDEPAGLHDIWSVFGDWKTWFYTILTFCGSIPFYTTAVFLPTIIQGMGFSKLMSQALTAPPYLLSFVVLISNSYHSDYTKERGYHAGVPLLLGSLGYISLVFVQEMLPAYLIICLTVGISFAGKPVVYSWLGNNFSSGSRRAIAIATVTTVANIGGLVAGQVYRDSDKPQYIRGHAFCATVGIMGFLFASVLKWMLRRSNQNPSLRAKEGEENSTEEDYIL